MNLCRRGFVKYTITVLCSFLMILSHTYPPSNTLMQTLAQSTETKQTTTRAEESEYVLNAPIAQRPVTFDYDRYHRSKGNIIEKSEWDDAKREKYNKFMVEKGHEPEAYLWYKYDLVWTYFFIDALTDTELKEKKFATLLFDTNNIGKTDPESPGVYYLELFFIPPERIFVGGSKIFYGGDLPSNPFSPGDCDYEWDFARSPLEPDKDPHTIYKVKVSTKKLTEHSTKIGFRSGLNYGSNLLYVPSVSIRIANSKLKFTGKPLPKYPHPLIIAAAAVAVGIGILFANKIIGKYKISRKDI